MGRMLKRPEIEKFAAYLDSALVEAREVERLTVRHPALSLSEAYAVQDAGIRLREARGERVIGYKMGLTSRAKREQMGLDTMIYGVLTDRMRVAGDFALEGRIHPKIEPEIGFVMARELRGSPSTEEARAACAVVFPAMEILDSRYVGFKYFSLPDVVADNSSSAFFVQGEAVRPVPSFAELGRLPMTLEVNGKAAQTALSEEIAGNPLLSLVELCRLLDARGLALPAGSVVLTGAATQAVALERGMTVRLRVGDWAPVTLTCA
jgi:2-oxo-3-hexenedioate decarboxylase